jgi:hypothetical protein
VSGNAKALRQLDTPAATCPECAQVTAYEWRRAWVCKSTIHVELEWTCSRESCAHDFDRRAYRVSVEQDCHDKAWRE